MNPNLYYIKDVDIRIKRFIYIILKDYKNICEIKKYNLIFKLIIINSKNDFSFIFPVFVFDDTHCEY